MGTVLPHLGWPDLNPESSESFAEKDRSRSRRARSGATCLLGVFAAVLLPGTSLYFEKLPERQASGSQPVATVPRSWSVASRPRPVDTRVPAAPEPRLLHSFPRRLSTPSLGDDAEGRRRRKGGRRGRDGGCVSVRNVRLGAGSAQGEGVSKQPWRHRPGMQCAAPRGCGVVTLQRDVLPVPVPWCSFARRGGQCGLSRGRRDELVPLVCMAPASRVPAPPRLPGRACAQPAV